MTDESRQIDVLKEEVAALRLSLSRHEEAIFDLEQAEDALNRSERRFHFLADAAIDAIVITRDGCVLDANGAAAAMFGYTDSSDLLGMAFSDLFSEPMREALVAHIARFSQDEHWESEGVRTDGEMFAVEIKFKELPYRATERVLVAAIRDISNRKRALEYRLKMEKQLQASHKMEAIGRLAGGLAHDMNNLLGVILSSATALEREREYTGEAVADIESIITACRRGRDLMRDLLGYARKGKYVKKRISLNRVVESSVRLLERASARRVEVVAQLESTLDYVEGDVSQLEHALMNLLINAVDAMSDGGVLTVATRNLPAELQVERVSAGGDFEPLDGRYVEVTVSDTGPGMDGATVDRAFEPFFTTKAGAMGTGLGLSMVYGTISNHNGHVSIQSAVGKGTTVTVILPSAARARSSVPSAAAADMTNAQEPLISVLLIDDESMILRSTRRVLEQMGHRVIAVPGGKEAVSLFREKWREVDVVILDMLMPGLDGSQTFELLQGIDPDVRVIICSGYARDEKIDALLFRGALEFVQKPFEIEVLSGAVKNALHRT